MDTFLVFDFGLTNCKVVLFDAEGCLRAGATVCYPTRRPRDNWAEQLPSDWWKALLDGLAQVRDRNEAALRATRAISVTGHMHSLVCLDDQGNAIGPAFVLGDQRGQHQAQALADAHGQSFFHRRTGARMDASMPLAKLLWMQEEEPARFARARHFLTCKDYIRSRLTGDRLTDSMDATGMALYDITASRWSPELCALGGIQEKQLPQLAPPWELAGSLLPGPAHELGLPDGLPVVVGAGDDVEVLGFGLDTPGAALEHFGTTGSILACTDEPRFDPAYAVEVYPHPIPGLWLLGGSISMAGAARAWALQNLRLEPDSIGDPRLPQRAPTAPPLLFLPHLAGTRCPQWNPGIRGSWLGLASRHRAEDLFQAVMEGTACALRHITECMEETGQRIPELRISPHSGETPAWLTLRASVYGRPLRPVLAPEPTALGAMMLAAVGMGKYVDLREAVAATIRTGLPSNPNPASREAYNAIFEYYLQTDRVLQELYSCHGLPRGEA